MSDDATRALERVVDEKPDDGLSRHRLTQERLRTKRGIVAWWHGPESPHQSAVKTTLGFTSEEPSTGQKHTERTPGWSVAVAGVSDFFDFAVRTRSCSFLELSSGAWLRTHARRSDFDTGVLSLEAETTTVDAFGRPRATVRTPVLARDVNPVQSARYYERSLAVVSGHGGEWSPFSIPNVGDYASRWRDEPIFDSEVLASSGQPSPSQVAFFANYYLFAFSPPTSFSSSKVYGRHTNMQGQGGLPAGWLHESTGVTVVFSDLHGAPIPEALEDELANTISIELRYSSTSFASIPGEAVVLRRHGKKDEDEGIFVEHSAPPVYPFAWPFRLQSLEQFRVVMYLPSGHGHELENVCAKVILSGFTAKGLPG